MSKYLEKYDFPDTVPPILSLGSYGQDLDTLEAKSKHINKTSHLKSIQVKPNDPVPLKNEEIFETVKNIFTESEISTAKEDFEKISHIFMLKSFHLNRLKEEYNLKSKVYDLSKMLPLYFYFYSSGPWIHYWVRFGYDPKLYSDNYMYQFVSSKKHHYNLIIKENSKMMREMEKNRDWYVSNVFDPKTGFLTPAFFDFFNYFIKTNQKDIVFEEESELKFLTSVK